ncbi:hypothetical protein ACFX12_044081 [Malus domestica]
MHVPRRFWSQALLTAAYIINRLPIRVLNSKSPVEVMKGRTIDISHLRTFGCTCYVYIQAAHRDKLDPRAVKSAFMGYSSTKKGYKYYNPHNGKIGVSKDVRFDENAPFFKKKIAVKNLKGITYWTFFLCPFQQIYMNLMFISTTT